MKLCITNSSSVEKLSVYINIDDLNLANIYPFKHIY